MGPSLLKGYFGLADSLYLQHNETFLPALRRCTTIEDVCYAFEKHKTILSEHITDVWEKSLELYEQNFSKIINVNKEYYDLPGTLIKDFLMAMRAFCVQKELSERWKDEMSRTCKLLFQIYTQIEYIKAGLNRIQGHKINLKEAGYVLFMERCYVSDILKRRYLDVFLTQKFLIVTEFDGKWYNCLDSIPIECFEIIVKPGKTTMQVNFGNANRKLYKLNFMDKKVFDRALSSFPSNNIVERK
ncbi:PREDICTED: uncharacterized protein LOC108559313 [Nicrophorus vespilloides]|uniref:Uncharacterized protein LOC108559313 n=1 Tax=Nicrophorus vespilloides TaxID=110193 RepID=A0ABM1MBU7_NICVS|nr:PREDICTED: uncharacterized protein LOC108559313 [Nicrophorus vespilloides]